MNLEASTSWFCMENSCYIVDLPKTDTFSKRKFTCICSLIFSISSGSIGTIFSIHDQLVLATRFIELLDLFFNFRKFQYLGNVMITYILHRDRNFSNFMKETSQFYLLLCQYLQAETLSWFSKHLHKTHKFWIFFYKFL